MDHESPVTHKEIIVMNQNKMLGIVLLVIGAIALYFGFNATNAPMEEVTEAFTGKYSDQTMLYLIGGAVAGVAGLVMLFRK
jgi:uncharacterized membrane protein